MFPGRHLRSAPYPHISIDDSESFTYFYQTHHEHVDRELKKRGVKHPDDRADLLHKVFTRAWTRRRELGDKALHFVMNWAQHEAQQYRAGQRRRQLPLESAAKKAGSVDSSDTVIERARLQEAFDLADESLKPIIAHVVAGFEPTEIAELFGENPATVRSRIKRYRDAAKEKLKAADMWRVLLLTPFRNLPERWSSVQQALAFHGDSLLVVLVGLLVLGDFLSGQPTLPSVPPTRTAPSLTPPPPGLIGRCCATPPSAAFPQRAMAPKSPVLPMAASRGAAAPPNPDKFIDFAASPQYQQDGTAVAVVIAGGCACPQLIMTTDAGRHWTASPVAPPVGAVQLALPPTFPKDPAIFVGTDPAGGGTPAWASAFGQSFAPLPLPPGNVAASVGDHGQRIVYGAGWQAAEKVELESGSVTLLATYPTANQPAALRSIPSGVLLAVPAETIVAAGGGGLPTVTTGTQLLVCQPSGCVRAVQLPTTGVGRLVVAPGRPDLVAYWWNRTLMLSVDGGRTFAQQETLPAGEAFVSVALVAGHNTDPVMWALIGSPAGIEAAALQNAHWEVDTQAPVHDAGSLVALTNAEILVLLTTKGLWCHFQSDPTWRSECP